MRKIFLFLFAAVLSIGTVSAVTVTIDDPVNSWSTYTGVDYNEEDGTWSKEYEADTEVTIGIDQLGDGWVFAYWTVGEEKIFTEEYTFTITEDVTITATYAIAMEVEFDNMELDQYSWVVTAGPDAIYGIELVLGIDVEGEHPKGFGLVEGSQIFLGEELELVTGYFTAIDPNAPSAEAVVIALYGEDLMAFVCSMTAASTPVVSHNVVVENATLTYQAGFLFMNSTWSDGEETYPVQVEIPGLNASVVEATYRATLTVGGQGEDDPWLGSAEGEVTVTVNNGLVTVTGSLENAWTSFNADIEISGTLPRVTLTVDDQVSSWSTYTGVDYNEEDGTWSKEFYLAETATVGISELGDGWIHAYWTVDGEKVYNETCEFVVTGDMAIVPTYAIAMEVEFDNMELDQYSWVVTAGPDAIYGIELVLGIDVEGEHPKGFGLVEGSQIFLGEELELVTGYFTAIDPDAPSAEAVVIALYGEELMAFVCSMTAAEEAPAQAFEILVDNATLNDDTDGSGFFFMNGTWSDGTTTYPVKVEIPGYDAGVASTTYMVTITVGGEGDDDPWLGFGEGEVTVVTVNGTVMVLGSIENAWSGFKADVVVSSGALPTQLGEGDNDAALASTTADVVQVKRNFVAGNLYTIALPFALNNVAEIFGEGTIVYEYDALQEQNSELVLHFKKVTAIASGTPYLIQPAQDVNGFVALNVTLSNTENSISFTAGNTTIAMESVLSSQASTGGKYWLAEDTWLYNDDVEMPALRALFNMSTTSGMPARARIALKEDAATGVDNLTTDAKTVKAIVNGQLVIIRGGEMYNVQGQLMK